MTPVDKKITPAVLLAALGIVYGDIGTSPLYAVQGEPRRRSRRGVGVDAIYGVLSMIFWSITLVVSDQVRAVVLRAHNEGEGGILALLALLLRQVPVAGRLHDFAIIAGLIGAAMFYGDSVITPAISVLSAIEGLQVVSPRFGEWSFR
jgi:KUP system potassium uptake protein